MNIKLSDHFTYKKLLRFTLPSICMMIFTSLYSVVDGYFVSNFAGKSAFTAVNFIMPFLMILGTFGFMFGTGGSALISKTLGEGKQKKANSLFSLIVYTSAITGVILAVFGIIFVRPIAVALGAEGEMLENCVIYGRIILAVLPAYMLQFEFQSFFVIAEKPNLGLAVTIASGLSNIVLDALLVAVFNLGLVGAAMATAISQCVGGIIPLIYFARRKGDTLKLGRAEYDGKALIKTCTNGSSELMSNISVSIVSMLYNMQLMKYAGENGVAAYGVLMYVNFIFLAIFVGYSVGTAPVIGYNYGADNHAEQKNLMKKGLTIVAVCSVLMFIASELLAKPLSVMFVGYDKELMNLALRGFVIYSFSFLFAGFAVFASSVFTALNNGLVSAAISFLRTLVFQVAAVMIFPLLLGIDGIWASISAAELTAAVVAGVLLIKYRKRYHY